MKVKCVKLINPNTGDVEDYSKWLKKGKTYSVSETYVGESEKIVQYRLISEQDGTPTLNDANQFELVSGYIPSNWSIDIIPGKYFLLSPKSWQKAGYMKTYFVDFWEAYFDGEDWARELYEKEVTAMIEEEEAYLSRLPSTT